MESFLLYTDCIEHISLLNMEQRGVLLTAILCFASGAELPEMDTAVKITYSFIRSQIERDRKKYIETTEKRSLAGKAGAKAKYSKRKQDVANDSKDKQTIANDSKGKQYEPVPEPVPVPEPIPEPDTESALRSKECKGKTRRSAFTPPTVDEVQEYCLQRGNAVDAERFVDHYTANGWMRGKTKIKDWKACVRTWEKQEAEFGGKPMGVSPRGASAHGSNPFFEIGREEGLF